MQTLPTSASTLLAREVFYGAVETHLCQALSGVTNPGELCHVRPADNHFQGSLDSLVADEMEVDCRAAKARLAAPALPSP